MKKSLLNIITAYMFNIMKSNMENAAAAPIKAPVREVRLRLDIEVRCLISGLFQMTNIGPRLFISIHNIIYGA